MALASFETVNGCADSCSARSAQATASECDDCSFGISFCYHLVSGKPSAEWRSLLTDFNAGIQDSVGRLILRLSSNFGDFTWLKFSSHNPYRRFSKSRNCSLPMGAHMLREIIHEESTAYSSKGQALQFACGLDFLSIQAYRLWMEHP